MVSVGTVLSGPIPPYSNPPIHPEYYEPSRFSISDIALGQTTLVTTYDNMNYVISQQVRLLIPNVFGSYQLNNSFGYVISIPSSNSVVVTIYSVGADAFIPNPYTATITNITQAAFAVVTANNNFHVGQVVQISDVSGMTEINTLVGTITARSSTQFTIDINSSGFSAYSSGGEATLFNVPQNEAQILAIGDINSGKINSSGNVNLGTSIPGSFINTSPN